MLSTPAAPREGPLPVLSSEEVVVGLENALSSAPPGAAPGSAALACDADGTLWSGDIGIDTFEALLEARAVRDAAVPSLRADAEGARLPIDPDPNRQARILYEGYLRGAYHEDRAFRMMAWIFAGFRAAEVRAFAATVVERVGLAGRLHAELLPVLSWAKERKLPVYVVSASAAIVVSAAIEILRLPVARVFAMTPDVAGDTILARVGEPATYGAGKIAALERGAPGVHLLGAFGDSAFDLALLRRAVHPVAVRPKPELRARARECPGLVELLPRGG